MKGTKKLLKITGVAKQCIDCGDLIDEKSKLICESVRRNPDWKEGMPFFEKYNLLLSRSNATPIISLAA
mgnify:CR=1 FL=1